MIFGGVYCILTTFFIFFPRFVELRISSDSSGEPLSICNNGPQSQTGRATQAEASRKRKRSWKQTCTAGIYSFDRYNKKVYRCSASADWLQFVVTYIKTLEEAIDHHIILTAVAQQLRSDRDAPLQERLLNAVHSVLAQHGIAPADFKFLINIQVPASQWIGRGLFIGCFRLQDSALVGETWARLREARAETRSDVAWLRLREIYLDVYSTRLGKSRVKMAQEIDRRFDERAPCREKIASKWNLSMMRRAEREQRAAEKEQLGQTSSGFSRQERWEGRRMVLEDRWMKRVRKQTLMLQKARSELDSLLATWGRLHEVEKARVRKRKCFGKRGLGAGDLGMMKFCAGMFFGWMLFF